MRILLILPVPRGSFSPPFTVLPLGLACIAGVAASENAEVRVLWGPDAIDRLGSLLDTFKPDIAGIQTFINNVRLSRDVANLIRKSCPGTVIVCGGVQASNFPGELLENCAIDCVIPGEGEVIFRNLITTIPDRFREVPGIIWKDTSHNLVRNPGAGIAEYLDDLPPIPYDLFYPDTQVHGQLLTHRGCPHHCSHCPLRFRAGVTIRAHSAARIVDTIRNLVQRYHIQSLEFFDENFTGHPDLVREICMGIGALNLSWSCTARVSEVDLDLAQTMSRAGCRDIIFGIGSGVDRLQTVLKTHEKLDYARDLIRDISEMNIRPVAVFSLGIPSETPDEADETIRYATTLKGAHVRFEAAAPLPGTLLYEYAKQGGHFSIDTWDDYVHPGQIVYIPAGWNFPGFRRKLAKARWRAGISNLVNHMRRRRKK